MQTKIFLDDELIRSLIGKTGRRIYNDSVIKPLKVVVTRRGATWVYRRGTEYKTLGSFPLIDTATARQASLGLMQGTVLPTLPIQPVELKPRQQVQLPTLTDALNDYTTTRRLKPLTVKDMQARIASLGRLASMTLDKLTPDVFGEWYTDKVAQGHATSAAAVGRYVRAVFKWSAVRYDIPTLADPTAKIRALTGDGFHAKAKTTRLTVETLPLWWASVKALDHAPTRILLMTYLLTGARKSELLELHTSNVTDTPHGIVIDLVDTKNGTDHRIYLGQWLSEQWRAVLPTEPRLVFAGMTTRLTRAVAQIRERAAVSVHDLRRSFTSFAHEAGCDLTTIKAMVNHSASSNDVTTRHYLTVSPDTMAKAWQTVETWTLNTLGEQQ